ncbi:hypothetical protein MMC14_003171 [Varicellaria rhodocarpa]|nr:hypothetical protein [Varicellaria rhodocarpa]
MDPSGLDPSFDLDPALAAQMGFASFGAQPSLKKRRYNPSTDAVVSTCSSNGRGKAKQEQYHSSGKNGAGSGGNNVPLGVRKVEGHGRGGVDTNGQDTMGGTRKVGGMGDEEEEEGGRGRRRGRDGEGKKGQSENKDEDTDDEEPVDNYSPKGNTYADSDHTARPVIIPPPLPLPLPLLSPSLPSQPKSNDGSSSIHDFTPTNTNSANTTIAPIATSKTSGTATPPLPPPSPTPETLPASNLAMPMTRTTDVPAPVTAVSTLLPGLVYSQVNGAERSHETQEQKPKPKQKQGPDWWALRKGVRDERGDVAYYDRSFVEDPWEELLQLKGDREGRR